MAAVDQDLENIIAEEILRRQESGKRTDSSALCTFLEKEYALSQDDAINCLIEVLVSGRIESVMEEGREWFRVHPRKMALNAEEEKSGTQSSCSSVESSPVSAPKESEKKESQVRLLSLLQFLHFCLR